MENINIAPVQEPENTLTAKKKIGKPEVFMIIALLLGGIIETFESAGIFSLIYFLLDALKIYIPYYILNFINTIGNSVVSLLAVILVVIINIIFAILAYKKNLRKSLRFLGIIFLANGAAQLMITVTSSVMNILMNNTAITNAVVRLVIYAFFNIIAVVIGVILLMVLEGKIASKKKDGENSVQEPENTVKRKKKKFGKPEVFMILAVVIAQFIVPNAMSLLQTVFSSVVALFIGQQFGGEAYSLYTAITSFIYSTLYIVLTLAVCILFAVFAYKQKKFKNIALFLGTFFATQSVVQMLIDKPVNFVISILLSGANLLGQYVVGIEIGAAVTTGTGIVSGLISFVIMSVSTVITAALAVILLMIACGKLKRKKKEETQETEEIPETEETPAETTEEVQENA